MSAANRHIIRLDTIVVRIRRRTTRSGIRHSVAISRVYQDGDTVKESTRFGRDDLPVIRAALDQAHTWIFQNRNSTDRKKD